MHPTISYHLAQARIAELHDQARRDALARATRRERRSRRPPSRHPAPVRPPFGRRILTALGVRAS